MSPCHSQCQPDQNIGLQSKNDASNVLKVKLYNAHVIKWYPRLLLDTEWEVKPSRGRQRKTWMKVITELLLHAVEYYR